MYVLDRLGRLRNIRKVKSTPASSQLQKQTSPVQSKKSVQTKKNGNGKTEKDTELYRIKAIFPFDFFPNELIIREKTVSMIRRGFLTSHTETMLVQDIGLVSVFETIIFASLKISYKAPSEDVVISTLPKNKAAQAKKILDQLMVVKNDQNDDEIAIITDNAAPTTEEEEAAG